MMTNFDTSSYIKQGGFFYFLCCETHTASRQEMGYEHTHMGVLKQTV